MAHSVSIRAERLLIPQGDRTLEFRATCSCGWTEKSTSEQRVREIAGLHMQHPHLYPKTP